MENERCPTIFFKNNRMELTCYILCCFANNADFLELIDAIDDKLDVHIIKK